MMEKYKEKTKIYQKKKLSLHNEAGDPPINTRVDRRFPAEESLFSFKTRHLLH